MYVPHSLRSDGDTGVVGIVECTFEKEVTIAIAPHCIGSMAGNRPPSHGSIGSLNSDTIRIEFRCQSLQLGKLPLWLESKAPRAFGEGNRLELSVVHYKGFGKTMDIRTRPPPQNMLSMMRAADVLVFDGDDFEVDGPDRIGANFVCALPLVCGSLDPGQEPALPALLAFKIEDKEAHFLDCWQNLRCAIGIDKLPFKVEADAPNWSPDRVIDVTYVLIPRSVCLPNYRGGILCSAAAASALPFPPSRVFESVLDDAKKIIGWVDSHGPDSLLPVALDGTVTQPSAVEAAGKSSAGETPTQAADTAVPATLHFNYANEAALHPSAKVYVSLGTLATLATAAVDNRRVDLKRGVVVWGGGDVVACELAVESALFMPTFPETLPWHYFHAIRSRNVGDAVQLQEGLLSAVRFPGLSVHPPASL